ncbi:MAG: MBL fold metallo-hydrolase [Gammaproteobacteria bacterium]|nr:MBL fold metallo-hydrolase [Gammaproteobacteria bacterium]MYD01398.1 MBL fold metallo-hydrolase [Gammaproteobacteria bacterium]MYI25298.1 MBL fold metallo-hydrolase [Gammaproteobacteria bacterium]
MTVRHLQAGALAAALAFFSAPLGLAGEIVKAAEGVYAAIGFGPSNSVVIAGEEAAILINAHHSAAAAEEAAAAYREVIDLPFVAVVYTHGDRSHVAGAAAFTGSLLLPDIYARSNFSLRRPATRVEALRRRQRQKGLLLDDGQRSPTLIDPLPQGADSPGRYLPPDKLIHGDRFRLRLAGVNLELIAAPGEAQDHLYVWLPERKVLITGANFHQAFPGDLDGLGDHAADLEEWARSLDRMRAERAEALIPGHTRPLFGAEAIDRALADYATALRFVEVATLRGIDAGLGPDELAAAIRLPPPLAASEVLAQNHGTLEWAVRSVYVRHMGWFDGEAAGLVPFPPRTLAWRLRELAESNLTLDAALDGALLLRDYRWAAWLADHLIQIEPQEARHAGRKARALEGMAAEVDNPQARNYLLSAARELRLKTRPAPIN